MDAVTKKLTIDYQYTTEKDKTLKRLLPFLLFLSFVWVNIYSGIMNVDSISVGASGLMTSWSYVIFSILFIAGVDYIVFELLFYVYRFLMGFSIYSFMIPKQIFINKFRLWFLIRNVLMGFVFNLRFLFPFISVYLIVVEVLFTMLSIICLYFDIARKYVDVLVGHLYFRAISICIIIYEAIKLIFAVVRVL